MAELKLSMRDGSDVVAQGETFQQKLGEDSYQLFVHKKNGSQGQVYVTVSFMNGYKVGTIEIEANDSRDLVIIGQEVMARVIASRGAERVHSVFRANA